MSERERRESFLGGSAELAFVGVWMGMRGRKRALKGEEGKIKACVLRRKTRLRVREKNRPRLKVCIGQQRQAEVVRTRCRVGEGRMGVSTRVGAMRGWSCHLDEKREPERCCSCMGAGSGDAGVCRWRGFKAVERKGQDDDRRRAG